MNVERVIEPALTWTGDAFEPEVRIAIDADGMIARVERGGAEAAEPWPRHAMLPGFVNAHSHAFQRGLRGRGESFPAGAGSFWTWREAMYDLVESTDTERLHGLTVQAFTEMRRAGITTVGEFHYLHHGANRLWEMDDVILDAARAVGIRLVLLEAYYRTGGIDEPLTGGQRRFATPDRSEYWARIDDLSSRLDPATQSIGVVAHSIRAASIDEIADLHAEARRRGLVFHMHVEEQPREIEACRAHYGRTPMALLLDRLEIGPEFTAVHCTHTAPGDLEAFLATGATVCICPTTEANLGDGIADLPRMRAAGGHVAVGTDSNERISMLEELRWLEYVQRLARESRGVMRDAAGDVARPLLDVGTNGGARALGRPAAMIAPGAPADLVAIDLDAAALAGAESDTLLTALLLGAGDEAIARTCVQGIWA